MPRRITLRVGKPAIAETVRDATPNEIAAVLRGVKEVNYHPALSDILRIIRRGGLPEDRLAKSGKKEKH